MRADKRAKSNARIDKIGCGKCAHTARAHSTWASIIPYRDELLRDSLMNILFASKIPKTALTQGRRLKGDVVYWTLGPKLITIIYHYSPKCLTFWRHIPHRVVYQLVMTVAKFLLEDVLWYITSYQFIIIFILPINCYSKMALKCFKYLVITECKSNSAFGWLQKFDLIAKTAGGVVGWWWVRMVLSVLLLKMGRISIEKTSLVFVW